MTLQARYKKGANIDPGEALFGQIPARELLRSSSNVVGDIDFSLVIPTYNRPRYLIECLEAISRLAYPAARYEVIVIDDGSEESLEPAVAPFLSRMNMALLGQSNSGPAAARNAGAAAARGHYVVFIDDDCRPDPNWLDALAKGATANPGCAVGGQTINGLPENLFSTASQLVIDYLYHCWNRDQNDAFFIASNNMVFPRERFLDLEGFDIGFPLAGAEDRELCYRWRLQRGRIVYAPDAIIHHFHTLNLKTFLAQHINYGRGAFIFRDVTRGCQERRIPVSRWVFYGNMPRYLMALDRGLRCIALVFLAGLSQAVGPLGWAREWWVHLRKSTQQQDRMDQRDGSRIQVSARGEQATRSRP